MSEMKASQGMKRKYTVDQNGSGPSKKKQNRSDEIRNRVVTDVNVEGFAESRAVEIQALAEVVNNEGGNHMAFQKLPRHMRRRAMSHNIKRVPRRLHQAVKSELEKTKPPGKRPSRYYRRRPRNLLAEYERRKRRIGWLETHIWHAKRFKMVQKWDYKLAFHPNEKSIRACYRAVNKHCLMQDVSYESYIEIKGPKQIILDKLSHLTSDKTGPTFAAKMTLSGTRLGKLTLYTYDDYPSSAIGQVTYLWQARHGDGGNEDEFNCSTLWICCHPSFYTQALVEINKCFKNTSNCDILPTTKDDGLREKQSEVSVVSLKDHLVKFRLWGPASNIVLSEVLQVADVESKDEERKLDKREIITESSNGTLNLKETEIIPSKMNKDLPTKEADAQVCGINAGFWWKDFYSSTSNIKSFRDQADAWSQLRKCHSPAEAPPNCILALTVRDPRLLLPPKKNKVLSVNNGSGISKLQTDLFSAGDVGLSPIWSAGIRENVKLGKISEHKLNELKSQQLIPGCPLQLGDIESRIPVILIQRPGTSSGIRTSSHTGYASGWDIIIPSGWAMAFWVALVYRGARVGGIREACSIALQAGTLCEPFDFPDSTSGREQLQTESEALQTRYNRRPPAKRPNYTKLGFRSPFVLEFNKLVNEWNRQPHCKLQSLSSGIDKPASEVEKSSFYVLRDRRCLRLLNTALTDIKGFLKSKGRTNGKNQGSGRISDKNMSSACVLEKIADTDIGRDMIRQHSMALVPILVSIHQRGIPATFGQICLPSVEDLDNLDKGTNFSGPLENKHVDPEAPIRKEERKVRLQLRRKKRRGKGSKIDNVQSRTTISKRSTSESPGKPEAAKDLREAHASFSDVCKNRLDLININTTVNSLLSHNSRMVCGFVRNGDFDLGKGHGSGLGFCSLVALLHLLEQQGDRRSCLVLVRNPTSFQYRFASLSVLI